MSNSHHKGMISRPHHSHSWRDVRRPDRSQQIAPLLPAALRHLRERLAQPVALPPRQLDLL